MTKTQLIAKIDRTLASKGIAKKWFTVTANGSTDTVLAWSYKDARRIVGNAAVGR